MQFEMEYTNPEIPEGINTSKEHPLKEFLILSISIIGFIVLVVFIMALIAELLAPRIPFALEKELAAKFISEKTDSSATQVYLQDLLEDISRHMDLPEDMDITLHYVDDDTENAFATMGGHIFIHRGLLEMMPNENALSMVIAHEVAHIQLRHPVIAMGRGVVIGLFLATITGFSGDRLVSGIVSNAGTITVLGFTREQERNADRTAIATINAYYGHVNGASDLFDVLLDIEKDKLINSPQFLSTHPLSQERIQAIDEHANEQGWSLTGKTKAMETELNQLSD